MASGTTVLSQKEYLKKYLSKSKKRKKKHKISSSSVVKRSQIIDDDGDDIIVKGSIDDEEYDFDYLGDEAPQIAGIVDERPLQVRTLEHYDQKSWTDLGNATDVREMPKRDISGGKKRYIVDEPSPAGNKLHGKETGGDDSINGTNNERSDKKFDLTDHRSPQRRKDFSSSKKKDNSENRSDSYMSPSRKSKIGKYSRDRGDSDMSPPRSSKNDKCRKGKADDSDPSPPRSSKNDKCRKGKADDSDPSPPRSSKHNKNRKGRDSDSDLSPPRSSKRDKNRKGRDSDSDLSPPRSSKTEKTRKGRGDDSDLSPPRSSKRDRSDKGRGSDSDVSLPRNRDRTSSKNLPSRSVRERDDDDDGSGRDSRGRRKQSRDDSSALRKHNTDRSGRNTKSDKMEKTLDGKKAGLQDATSLRRELGEIKMREQKMFQQLASEDGAAAPIMRDRKTGKRRDLQKEQEESAAKAARQALTDETYSKWGRGLKQVEDSRRKLSEAISEMSKPLARYATDADLEDMLKAQEREGDPMLDYIKQKQAESINLNEPSKPKYKGSFTPNRFGLAPGYRWDGVDRSNGYEKSWFEHANAKKAVEQEAYKWSTSDM